MRQRPREMTVEEAKAAVKVTEAEFTTQVLKLAKLRGWRSAHFRPAETKKGWRTAVQGDGKGFPDLVLLRGEDIIVAELKVGRNKPTTEQEEWLEAFNRANVSAWVWTPNDWPEIESRLGRGKQ